MFVIFNGTHFICNCNVINGVRYDCTRYLDSAKKFCNKIAAQNEINNMHISLKRKGEWKIVDECELEKYYPNSNHTNFSNEIIDKEESKKNDVKTYIKELKEYKRSLLTELSYKEKEQQDLLHYCEFYEYDSSKAKEFYNTLRDIRKRRRFIKNELFRLDKILKADSPESERYYTPKTEMSFLFD